MAVYIAKLIFHKNDLKNISLSVAKEHMIITSSSENQEACHSFWNEVLCCMSHSVDIHLFKTKRMAGGTIGCIPINRT